MERLHDTLTIIVGSYLPTLAIDLLQLESMSHLEGEIYKNNNKGVVGTKVQGKRSVRPWTDKQKIFSNYQLLFILVLTFKALLWAVISQ